MDALQRRDDDNKIKTDTSSVTYFRLFYKTAGGYPTGKPLCIVSSDVQYILAKQGNAIISVHYIFCSTENTCGSCWRKQRATIVDASLIESK